MRTQLGVVSWEPVPGEPLPMPFLRDDSEAYDPRTVRDVQAWLRSVAAGFDARRPTATLIRLYRNEQNVVKGHVHYGLGMDAMAAGECGKFRTTTVEFFCEKDPILARYRYLAAVDDSDLAWPKFILGPCLGVLPGPAGQQVIQVQQTEKVLVRA